MDMSEQNINWIAQLHDAKTSPQTPCYAGTQYLWSAVGALASARHKSAWFLSYLSEQKDSVFFKDTASDFQVLHFEETETSIFR